VYEIETIFSSTLHIKRPFHFFVTVQIPVFIKWKKRHGICTRCVIAHRSLGSWRWFFELGFKGWRICCVVRYLHVCVNWTESVRDLSIFSVRVSRFPHFPYHYYGSVNQDISRPVRRPVTALQAIHVQVMRTLV
jgi:hypothetical protein